MARIEKERPRKPGEKVDILHPEYPMQNAEDRREDFAERYNNLLERVSTIEDPKVQEVLQGIMELVRNLNSGLLRPEFDYAERQRDRNPEYESALHHALKTPETEKPGPRLK